MKKQNTRVGSSLNDFLKDEGTRCESNWIMPRAAIRLR